MASNIKIKNIYYMLAYAYETLYESSYKSIELEEFSNIHDLLSSILIKGISAQVKRGLHRDYIIYSETLGSLRGKIDITSSVKEQTIISKKMVCQYDLFSEDTKLNQVLKATMMVLLRFGDVKTENKKALRKLLLYFHNVSEIDVYHIKWNTFNYHRNNAAYQMLINICYLVIKGLLLSTTEGKYKMAQFIDDQQMHRLYEKFVRGYYKREYPQISVSASYINWDLGEDDSKMFLPVMKTDITLSHGRKTLIIDTKYYGHIMQVNTMFNSASIISQNLYQIFTYVKNKDKYNTGDVSGMLLYAKTDELITPDNDYVMGGNRISVKTLNLDGAWEEIRRQLDNIAVPLMGNIDC